jgi:hypothetical protein
MKNLKNQFLLILVLVCAVSVNAQDYLMTLKPLSASVLNINKTEPVAEPLINNTTYTYKYKGGEVVVVFEGNEHYEFYNNRKHFIKSDLVWTSKKECFMIIKDYNLPNFPFKIGTKMKMKITKKKDGYVNYTTTLGGRTWKGKMKEAQ